MLSNVPHIAACCVCPGVLSSKADEPDGREALLPGWYHAPQDGFQQGRQLESIYNA